MGAPKWPPNPPTLAAPRETRGAARLRGDDLDGLDAVADLDRIDDVHAARDPTEDGVLAVQLGRRGERDVELAARGIGVPAARHGQHATVVLARVELGLELIAGAAGPQARIARGQ